MTYKLVAIDVDGTLINDEYRITAATAQTIKALYGSGVHIVLCTGRGPASTLPLLEQLGLHGIAITHNGAATVRSEDAQVLHRFAFERSYALAFIDDCRRRSLHFNVNTALDLYVEQELTDKMLGVYSRFFVDPIAVDDALAAEDGIVKLSVYDEQPDTLDRLMERWPQLGHEQLAVIRSGPYYVDVVHADATKGNALRMLALQLGIAPEHILAIGNYYNDADMLQFAGLGVAMGNAPEDVKGLADAVTASNNEDGVHLALRRYCF